MGQLYPESKDPKTRQKVMETRNRTIIWVSILGSLVAVLMALGNRDNRSISILGGIAMIFHDLMVH